MSHAEQVVDDFEAGIAGRVVHGGYVRHHGVLGRGVVFQEREDGDDAGGGDVDCELVFPDGELLDVFREGGKEVLAVGVQGGGFFLVFVCWVYDRGVELASSCAID